jgi:hypothetical protein
MSKALRISALAIAGATATGLIGYTAPALAKDGDGAAYKRDDESGRVITTADLDDDDDGFAKGTNTQTNTGGDGATNTNNTNNTNSHAGDNTGDSRSRADGTNSRVTNVSNDRDQSRADLTKDWTRDGGDKTRDHSRNATNDRSRNDTRG